MYRFPTAVKSQQFQQFGGILTSGTKTGAGVSLKCLGFKLFFLKGLTHIITMDLHQKEIQGFFGFPVDNLRASPFLIQYIQEEVTRIFCFIFFLLFQILQLLWNTLLHYETNKNNVGLFSYSRQIPDYRNAIIVAKSPAAAKRYTHRDLNFFIVKTNILTFYFPVKGSVVCRAPSPGSRCDPRGGSVFRVWHGRWTSLAAMCSQHHWSHRTGAAL